MYFVLFCTLVIAFSEASQIYVDLPANIVAAMREQAIECMEQSGADSGTLDRLFKWQFEDTDTSKLFNYCMFTNLGIGKKDGHFDFKQVAPLFVNSDQQDEIAKTVTECNKIVAENPLDTMYQTLRCFYLKSPVLLNVNVE